MAQPRLFRPDGGREMPATMPIQPRPVLTRVTPFSRGGVTITAIVRNWARGDAARCLLCDSCDARLDSCIVVVDRAVTLDEAAMFRAAGIPTQARTARVTG